MPNKRLGANVRWEYRHHSSCSFKATRSQRTFTCGGRWRGQLVPLWSPRGFFLCCVLGCRIKRTSVAAFFFFAKYKSQNSQIFQSAVAICLCLGWTVGNALAVILGELRSLLFISMLFALKIGRCVFLFEQLEKNKKKPVSTYVRHSSIFPMLSTALSFLVFYSPFHLWFQVFVVFISCVLYALISFD